MAWIYFQASVESGSLSSHGSEQSPIVSATDTLKVSFCPGCDQVKLIPLQSGTTLQPSEEICCQGSTSSSEDSHARISASQSKIEKAWTESAVAFSFISFDLPESPDQLSFFSKMSLPSEQLEPREWSKNWPGSGMTVDGRLFRPPVLEPHTEEIDGFYWRTPNANDASRGPMSLDVAKNGGHQISLVTQVKHPELWPESAQKQEISGQLSPIFCEWLMGYRTGWTELDALGTRWFRYKSEQRSKNSRG